MAKSSLRVGITIGDPSGVGPVITYQALKHLKKIAQFVVIGDEWLLKKVSKGKFNLGPTRIVDLQNVERKGFVFGKVCAKYGSASIEYLDEALKLIKAGQIDCLVTCPISKEAIHLAGFNYSGHTEYFSQKLKVKYPVMMLLNKELKFSLVTRHLAIKAVPLAIKKEFILKNILLTHRALEKLFLIENPRLVVCGLNPHASDNGLLGNEENAIIKPSLAILRKKIGPIAGPLSSDIAISKAYEKKFDCVIAMYHDQALIPLKLSGQDTGVNLTLGLPFIRTSHLHGTAFDIARSNSRAIDPSSLINAILLAVKCTKNQKRD
jgi:4-hydroxythreonine-4-phosphate dehydrogenase